MPQDRPGLEYASVRAWDQALAEHWGGDPLTEDPSRLDALLAFCEYFGKNPDELLQYCFLRRKATGEKFPSKKRREEITAKVAEFTVVNKLTGVEARRQRNHIFSFLSHNGVLI